MREFYSDDTRIKFLQKALNLIMFNEYYVKSYASVVKFKFYLKNFKELGKRNDFFEFIRNHKE